MNKPPLLTPVAGFHIGDVVVSGSNYPPMEIVCFAEQEPNKPTLAVGKWTTATKEFTRTVAIDSLTLLAKLPNFDTSRGTREDNGAYWPLS